MNGAETLVQALSDAGVNVCFTNPGTTEIHLVAALAKADSMRTVLGLFEGVCSGAADGYARMTGRPAATLFHLGAGLGNAVANLHNARRAHSPVVNLVGDHPVHHRRNDPPLASDIASLAGPVSGWVHEAESGGGLAGDALSAVSAAMGPPGRIATLIIPADCAWSEGRPPTKGLEILSPKSASPEIVKEAAEMLQAGGSTALFLGGAALLEPGIRAAGRIARKTGASLMSPTFDARLRRGAGLPLVRRLPYFPEKGRKRLASIHHLVLAGAPAPTAFFAYPDSSVQVLPVGCEIKTLAGTRDDTVQSLEALADFLGARKSDFEEMPLERPEKPTGPLTAETAGTAIGALLPEEAIVSDESGTSGAFAYRFTAGAPPHDWLCLTGGSIGQGIPVATGAAVACPDRKVICLQGDGGAMYTIQALWTQAREGLDVTTIIFSNRKYQILEVELSRFGFTDPDQQVLDTTALSRPDIDWVKLSEGLGVAASRAETAEAFTGLLEKALVEKGPHLIEALI